MESYFQTAARLWTAEITPSEKLVALCILSHRNSQTGLCNPSFSRLSRLCGYSRPTIARTISHLKEYGLIESKRTGAASEYSFPESTQRSITHDTSEVSPMIPKQRIEQRTEIKETENERHAMNLGKYAAMALAKWPR